LHFFSTHQNFQHKGKLHRAEFQKVHHLLRNRRASKSAYRPRR
jgi:hypothetical protein